MTEDKPPADAALDHETSASVPTLREEGSKVVYVIDDHPMVRELIAAMLRRQAPHVHVIEFASLAQVRAGSAAHPVPDLICLDLRLEDSMGVRTVSEIKALHPLAPLVVLSASNASELEAPCLQAGAHVYIEKTAGTADLRATLRALLLPESGFDDTEPGVEIKLSRRQKQIIAMLDRGLSNREMATELALSEHTIKVHMLRLFKRLGVNSRTQVLHVARMSGLLN